MNWIGGARARARIKEQFNVKGNRPGNNQQDFADATSNDDQNDDERGYNFEDDGYLGQRQCDTTGPRRKSNAPKPEAFTRRTIDYNLLGYRLARLNKVQRRVVPLLEFLEKKIPNGQVLSLQLSHLMDITWTPRPEDIIPCRRLPCSESSSSTNRRPNNSSLSVNDHSSRARHSIRLNTLKKDATSESSANPTIIPYSSTSSSLHSHSSAGSSNNKRASGSMHNRSITSGTSNVIVENHFKVPAVPSRAAARLFQLMDEDDDESNVESSILIQ